MSYNPNIPVSSDPILQSQRQIKSNFQAIANSWSVNHHQLTGDSEFRGMHTALTLRPYPVLPDPDPSTTVDQVALYNKSVSANPELFFRPSGDQDPIQLSYQNIKIDKSNNQYTFMAGPFLVYGGKIINPTNDQIVILSPGSQLIHVDLIATNSLPNPPIPPIAIATNIVGTSFTIKKTPTTTPNPFDLYYFAVGLT